MLGIANSPGRRRVLVLGELVGRSGQRLNVTLNLLERSLIEYATFEGFELLNQQGTKPRVHSIGFSGSRIARSWLLPELTIVNSRRQRSRR